MNDFNRPLPALDRTTPWYSYLSYQQCCLSLGIRESLTKWLRYNTYFKQNFNENEVNG